MRRWFLFVLLAVSFAFFSVPDSALAVIPSTPNLYSPAYGGNASGTVVNFSWYAADGAVDYYFEMATDAYFTNTVVEGWTGGTGVQITGMDDDGQIYYWRVTAWSYDGSATSFTWYFYNGPSAAPPTPSIVSPSYGANVSGTTVSLQWNQAARANNYYLQVATDSGFVNTIVDEWIGDYIGINLNVLDDGTTYYWRVAAGNSVGSSNYTTTYYFVNGPSAAPATPSIVAPGYGSNAPGATVLLQWSQAARANNYYVQVATDSGFVNKFVDEWVGNYLGLYLNLPDDGSTYYWRVASGNSLGSSNYTTTYHFVNGPSAIPAVPVPSYPGYGANVSGTTVALQWGQAARATNYYLQVATDSGFTNPIVDEWIGNYIGVNLNLLDDGQVYYWRVAAGNSLGTSSYSTTYYFTNGPSAVPVTPGLTSPGNGTKINGSIVIFQWTQAARANDYRLQLALDSGFTEVVFDEWLGNYIGIQLTGLPDNGQQFYWRVAAGNSLGSSGFTTGWNFVNGPSAVPAVPSMSSPTNGSVASGSSLILYWNPAQRANDYRVQLAIDSGFNNVVFDEWIGNYIGIQLNGFRDIGDQFYWRVSARNSLGESSFPYAWYFINGPSSVPPAPALVAPANNSNAEGYGLNFYWQAAARAESYDIQVATDINFNSIMKEETVLDLTAYIDGFANVGQDFYWRVAGMNSLGTGPFSTPFKFTNGTAQECVPVTGTGYGLLGNFYSHVDTCKDINNNYFMKDISRRWNLNPHLHNGQMNSNAEIRTELYNTGLMKDTDGNNIWNAANQKSAVDAHQHTSMVYDYFLNSSKLWSLNSYDGHGISMVNIVETPCGDDNAYWDGDAVNFCTGVNYTPLSAAIDIVAHEWGHAVTDKAAVRNSELIYEKQSGALNEGFSDWIGAAVNRYYGRPYWTIGEGVWVIRSLQNPKLYDQPDTYKDTSPGSFWFETDNCVPVCNPQDPRYNDCCGVHTNSGIPNKVFYLLGETGTHTHNGVSVQGLGITAAMRIGYWANVKYWSANATFLDALNGMVDAARELYGEDTNEMNQVKNAWAAVKVTTLPVISTSLSPAEGGSTSGGGTYEWGDVVTVTATPNSGYLFQNWTVNGTQVSTSANYTFTVNGTRNLVANFAVIPPTISVTPTSNDFGSVLVGAVSTPKSFTITNQGSQPLVIGTVYRDGTNPAEFLKYSDGCTGQSIPALGSCMIQMQFTPTTAGAKTAILAIPSNDTTTPLVQASLSGTGVTVSVYSITATSGVGGSISPSGTVSVTSNGSQTFTITPNIGFHLSDVKVDGGSVGAVTSYTFSNVTGNHTIDASFAVDLYTITTSAGTGGTISPTTAVVSYGGSQTFTITPNTGYAIANVVTDGISRGAITSYTFSNVTSGHSISASFDAIACPTLPVSISRPGSFSQTYQTLQEAFDAALTGDTIMSQASNLTGDLNINRNISIAAKGGYSCDFSTITGITTIKGNLTISSGTLIVDNLAISN